MEFVISTPNIGRQSGSIRRFLSLRQYFDSLLQLHDSGWNIQYKYTQLLDNIDIILLRSRIRSSTFICSSSPSPTTRSSTTSPPWRSSTSTSTSTSQRSWTPWTRAPTPGSWGWDINWSLWRCQFIPSRTSARLQ